MHTQRFQLSEDIWIAWDHNDLYTVQCTLRTCTPYNSYIPRTHSQWGEALWITCHQVLCPKADKKCSLTAEYCKLSVGVFGVSSHPLWILTAAAAAILQAGFWGLRWWWKSSFCHTDDLIKEETILLSSQISSALERGKISETPQDMGFHLALLQIA